MRHHLLIFAKIGFVSGT